MFIPNSCRRSFAKTGVRMTFDSRGDWMTGGTTTWDQTIAWTGEDPRTRCGGTRGRGSTKAPETSGSTIGGRTRGSPRCSARKGEITERNCWKDSPTWTLTIIMNIEDIRDTTIRIRCFTFPFTGAVENRTGRNCFLFRKGCRKRYYWQHISLIVLQWVVP